MSTPQALLEGRELGEIADAEGIPYDTMQKRFAYVRKALKRRLTDTSPDGGVWPPMVCTPPPSVPWEAGGEV